MVFWTGTRVHERVGREKGWGCLRQGAAAQPRTRELKAKEIFLFFPL